MIEVYPVSEDTCAPSCGWFMEKTACEQVPAVRKYATNMIPLIVAAQEEMGRLPRPECVCLVVHLSASGELSDIVVEKTTSEWAAQRATDTVRAASPLPPVVTEARCMLDAPLNPLQMSFGGGRR